MNSYIQKFADDIRLMEALDKLIKVENFPLDKEHTGYLYAYKTGRGVHIDTAVSIGDCDFTTPETMYCGHTLHEYLNDSIYTGKTETLEKRIDRLLGKTLFQLDILAPIERQRVKDHQGDPIL